MKFSGLQLSTVVKNLDGDAIMYSSDESKPRQPLTIKMAIRMSLTTTFQNDNESGEDKFKSFELARNIYLLDPDKEIELKAEDCVLIKKKVSKLWVGEVIGFIYDFIEGKGDGFGNHVKSEK